MWGTAVGRCATEIAYVLQRQGWKSECGERWSRKQGPEMQLWPFIFLTFSRENCEEHRHDSFRPICTMHHTKNSDGVANKPAAGLGRERATDT